MQVEEKLAIAILNCYPRKSRENFDRSDVGHPHDLYKDFLKRYVPNAETDLIFIADEDGTLPTGASLESYDAFIWTGSDLTVYHTDDPRVTRQVELARAIYEAGGLSYGSCWGVQMAAYAAGGEVKANPKGREWSIARNIKRTDAGKQSLLLKGKPDEYDGFIMHLDEITSLPAGATLLATNEHTHVQALEVKHANGTFWATQYHPEYNLHEMARLINARGAALTREGFFESEEKVLEFAAKQFALAKDPANADLRAALNVGDDILDPAIREVELRNWIDYLVLPNAKR